MFKYYIVVFLVMALMGSKTRVYAIAVEDDSVAETNPVTAGYSLNWDYVYKYNGASSVAVDHYWVLTAGHVASSGGMIEVDGETYPTVEFVKHSEATDPDGNPTADLALIRFERSFPGYYLLHESIPQNEEILAVGYGFPGDVVINTFSGYFTEDRTGSRIKRWGTNKIDKTSTVNGSKGFDFTISGSWGNGKTAYEVGCNDKDSGSGIFYNDGGVWKIVGTVVNRYGASPEFTGNFAVGTHHYANWIKSVIVDYDTDMDGLPDWWEAMYGVTEAGADPDADGFSNYEEWMADTIPTNATSRFQVYEWAVPTNVTFSSSVNRKYQIEYRTDLVDSNETWQEESAWSTGTGTQNVDLAINNSTNRFYHIRVKLR